MIKAKNAKLDESGKVTQFLTKVSKKHNLSIKKQLVEDYSKFDKLTSEINDVFRGQHKDSIQKMINEVRILDLITVRPLRQEINEKLESFTYLTDDSDNTLYDTFENVFGVVCNENW